MVQALAFVFMLVGFALVVAPVLDHVTIVKRPAHRKRRRRRSARRAPAPAEAPPALRRYHAVMNRTPDGPIGTPEEMRPRLERWRQQAALEVGEDPTKIA